jgi:YkoP-like protein
MARATLSVAPRALDPILSLVERIDRGLRHIAPVGPGAVLGLERHRHRGQPVSLTNGTVVRAGDEAWIVHFDNRRIRELAKGSYAAEAWRAARRDMGRIAARHAALPERERPVAYTGITVLAALPRRAGFELRPRRATAWTRLQDWYLRSLLARWDRDGRGRLGRGHQPLVTQEVWLSAAELLRRYGSSPPPE